MDDVSWISLCIYQGCPSQYTKIYAMVLKVGQVEATHGKNNSLFLS